MDEVDFTLGGQRFRLTRETVISSMQRQVPGRIHTYAVAIDGVSFPVKQVLAQSLQIPAGTFISTRAQAILGKLGFVVVNVESGGTPASVSNDGRLVALELAVGFESGRLARTVDDVIETANRFELWLAG